MNLLIRSLITYLNHQDILKKQIVSWDEKGTEAVATLKTGSRWLAAQQVQKGDFEKVFLGCYTADKNNCMNLVEATLNDQRVRIILFDKSGLRAGHIIPSHIKTNVTQYVTAVLKNT